MANRRGKIGSSERFYIFILEAMNIYFIFIADSKCSHEIKRCLLPGRRAMKNLDSMLKSRHITLLTKVYIVKAMVFPVFMCRCDSWTIKNVERKDYVFSRI